MKKIPLYSYSYLFNATIREFDLDGALENFINFFDSCSIATVKSEDDTLERLKNWEKKHPKKINIVETEIPIIRNNRFDGQLKTVAMNSLPTDGLKVIMDMDEKIPHDSRLTWDEAANILMSDTDLDGFLIPVIDLYGDKYSIRSDRAIGMKFRIHKNNIVERGVPVFAELGNGLFDTSKSDSTEPLLKNKQLGVFKPILANPLYLNPTLSKYLRPYPYVLHEGFLQLDRRAKLGKEFWKENWEIRSGKEEKVATTVEELQGPTIKHGLKL